MGLMINERKLKAAVGSMHQFCQLVREVFPGDVDDRVVEATTVYLYTSLTRDLFGPRFAAKLGKQLRSRLKYSTPAEVAGYTARLAKRSEALEKREASMSSDRSPEEVVRAHVTSTIEAMLLDAGFQTTDQDVLKKTYERFDHAIRAIRSHLVGIREQNYFLMQQRRSVA